MFFLFKNYSLVKVIYLLIRSSKTKSFLSNTRNTDNNDINERNTHITRGEKENFRKA